MIDDGHGNVVPDWTTPDTLAIDGCSVQPGLSREDLTNRDATLIAYTVFAPSGADVVAQDRIVFGGVTFEVDGDPQQWATGISDHAQFFLKRWDG
jgi:hypothetical protein